MKLVQVLAKELSVWPEIGGEFTCDPDGEIRHSSSTSLDFYPEETVDEEDRADDYGEMNATVITEDQWQAERDKQKDGEWKRHRGRKIPVSADSVVDVKLDTGEVMSGEIAGDWEWSHADASPRIMQYRIISQPQAEEVEVKRFCMGHKCEATAENIEHSKECLLEAEMSYTGFKIDQIDGPIKWRDTIIHCQAIIEDCEREIQRNVDLLDAEGLMMQTDSKKAMQHYEEPAIAPFKEWRVGDIVEVISLDTFCDPGLRVGDQMPITHIDNRDGTVKVASGAWGDEDNYKFVRRP